MAAVHGFLASPALISLSSLTLCYLVVIGLKMAAKNNNFKTKDGRLDLREKESQEEQGERSM